MSRTVGKPTHSVIDMWIDYAKKLLANNPEYYSRKRKGRPHDTIYRKNGDKTEVVMNYTLFRKIIEFYFDKAKTEIINGNAINMTNRVGKICAKRVERDFRKKSAINWKETKKQPIVEVDGKSKYKNTIYFTDKDWCRIGWFKVNNIDLTTTIYEFKPTSPSWDGSKGFVAEFSKALINNPILKYKYLYQPVRP